MNSCSCQSLQGMEKVGNHTSFFVSLDRLEVGNWVRLCMCQQCRQLWAVSEWDKYQTQLAAKVPDASRHSWECWYIEAQKSFLIRSRGGISPTRFCAWAGCGKPCVEESAYCVDHLYETGARE